jgi:hypothetical protein
MLTLFKGPSCVLDNRERVDSLVEKGRLCLCLIVLTLFKGPSYMLNSEERVDDFIKGERLR